MPGDNSDDEFVTPDSPATIERKHKAANTSFIKMTFKNALNKEGISDDTLQNSR